MKIRKILMIIILFLISGGNRMLESAEGESGIGTLMLDSYGAREIGLGDTFTGIADDINTMSVNAGGLNTLKRMQGSIMYMRYPAELSFTYLSFGMPIPKEYMAGYGGISAAFFSIGDEQEYDENGNATGNSLTGGDMVITLGYGNNVLKFFGMREELNAGINIKYIHSSLGTETGGGIGFDIGVLYKIDVYNFGKKIRKNLGIGISLQNIGTSIKYEKEGTSLPQNFRIGAGYKGYKDRDNSITAGFDINIPNDGKTIMSIGIEYSWLNTVYGRIGYKISGPEAENISFGIGGRYMLMKKEIGFDYALVPLSDIGVTHTFSIGVKW